MTCRACGARIAEKAIVCYRCGAPTALPDAPVRRTGRSAARRTWWRWIAVIALLLAVLWAVAHFLLS